MASVKVVDWYFDVISPFAYLMSERLDEIAARSAVEIRPRPLLFAGLLEHWGHKGPAEIPPKRDWTFTHVAFLAHRHGIPLVLPRHHPFNPLPMLRLAIACGRDGVVPLDVVHRLFRYVWAEGNPPHDAAAWAALLTALGTTNDALASPEVKARLRANGEDAIARGVFGVPTAIVDGDLFWGFDSIEMLLARLAGDPWFDGDAARAARALPAGAPRPSLARS